MITDNDLRLLVKAASGAGFTANKKDFKLLKWPKGIKTHSPTKLQDGFFAIYIFKYHKTYLKVGKVSGHTNNDRYYQHHYIVKASNSNLAKSLVGDKERFREVKKKNVRNWIITNTSRYNILIPRKYGALFVNFAEAFFLLKCKPFFEGRKSKK